MTPDWTMIAVIAILTGPSYGILALGVLAWLWRRRQQPEIHVHYDWKDQKDERT
jgi:hypothetical protein